MRFPALLGLMRTRRRRRAAVRFCPLCGADTVDCWSRAAIDLYHERVELHCARCGVWRRLDATMWTVNAYERRAKKGRKAIASALRRLEREETEAFVHRLEHDVVGAEDFVAAASAHPGGPGS